ncbi:MAG TPA: RES family NAD+ phosphorylase [Chloroflexota bacterium]|nr:RES family NAD+ phosphorylase [Chloroflexota bacterium]
MRVYDPGRFATRALTFRAVGPASHFDHHRAGPPASLLDPMKGLWHDPDRAISYFGLTLSCCLVEVFGDTLTIERTPWEMAVVELTAPVTLLDLRDNHAMLAGTVEALCKTEDRDLTQRWGRYFYQEIVTYGVVDGLRFHGAHNSEDCFALFERAAHALVCEPGAIRRLSDPALDWIIEDCALRHNMLVA